MELEEGDVVLCTVERIIGTTVFVNIEGNGEGSIIFSEVAPGRIRNIRDYIVPRKKIVCKVLRLKGDRIELSLRRVNQEERKNVLDEYKQEKSYISMLKSILGEEKSRKAIDKISKENRLYDFFQEAKKNPSTLNKIFDKKDIQKIIGIISSEKQKITEIKKEIHLKTQDSEGLTLIKEILMPLAKEIEIRYISAGRYSLKKGSENAKKADSQVQEIIKKIEKKAKKKNMEFSILKK